MCSDVGAIAAFAHEAGIGTGAHHQLQGVHQNGFARAGLACERGKAVVNVQIQSLHDHEILQGNTP